MLKALGLNSSTIEKNKTKHFFRDRRVPGEGTGVGTGGGYWRWKT